MTHDELLAYYTAPGPFTALDGFADEVVALPDDVGALAKVVQNLLVHRAWAPAYQFNLSPERESENGLHGAVAMLSCAQRMQATPIADARPADRRVVTICRHFATLFVAFMRHTGVPARARCGFGAYFEKGKRVDHWVAEYWNAHEKRWVLVDAQIDGLQKAFLKPPFDTLDVPRDQFIVAGDAWRMCESGEADPATFGIADMWGLWYVCGNIMMDIAALQNIELLPWEQYGLTTEGEGRPQDRDLAANKEIFRRLAAISSAADAPAVTELRALAASDPRIRVPSALVDGIIAADRAGGTGVNPLSLA